MKMMKRAAWLLLAAAGLASSAQGVVYRVTQGGAGVSTTWATPGNLQATLAAAVAGDTIEVGAGTYKPGPARTDSFVLNGETLVGGFPAAGGPISNPVLNVTVLSGDIGAAGVVGDNCYHVVKSQGGTIDGFHIRGGNADGTGAALDSRYGGGVYAIGSTVITRTKIQRNRGLSGGGVYFYAAQPGMALIIGRTTIVDNDAVGAAGGPLFLGRGGGVLAEGSDYAGQFTMNRCSVLGNTATADGGGIDATMTISVANTVFSGNSSAGGGGGGAARLSSLPGPGLGTMFNCTVANNQSSYGLGGGGVSADHLWLVNNILWGNTATGGSTSAQQVYGAVLQVEYCDVQGWAAGGAGNVSSNPNFTDPLGADGAAGTEDDDLRLKLVSPCRDTGRNSEAATPFDRDGQLRILKSRLVAPTLTVDMGAYEHKLEIILHPPVPGLRPPALPH